MVDEDRSWTRRVHFNDQNGLEAAKVEAEVAKETERMRLETEAAKETLRLKLQAEAAKAKEKA